MNTELEKDENEEEGEEKQEEDQEEEVVNAPLQLKLLAHDLLCGRIIGKGGNNLKQVRQDSGVNKLIISNSMYVIKSNHLDLLFYLYLFIKKSLGILIENSFHPKINCQFQEDFISRISFCFC